MDHSHQGWVREELRGEARFRGGLARRGCVQRAPRGWHQGVYTLHPTPCTLHPKPYTLDDTLYPLHPTPYTLHPKPCTLDPTLYPLHPTPCTLHRTDYRLLPTPRTPHSTPCTLHPTPCMFCCCGRGSVHRPPRGWHQGVHAPRSPQREKDFFIDNLLVRIHLIIEIHLITEIPHTPDGPHPKPLDPPPPSPQTPTLNAQRIFSCCGQEKVACTVPRESGIKGSVSSLGR